MITQRMMVRGVKSAPETWQFTVNTEAIAAGAKKTGIPFNLYGQTDVKLSVDWGDGARDVVCSTDYPNGGHDNVHSIHEYENAGIYNVTVKCDNPSIAYVEYAKSTTTVNGFLDLFKRTLVSLDGPIPNFRGVRFYDSSSSIYTVQNDSLFALFYGCINLSTINAQLFIKMADIDSVESTFDSCSSLLEIPYHLFDENINIRSFYGTFRSCTSLTNIPAGLFDKNVLATNFNRTFYGCENIIQIPEYLFSKNTLCEDFYRTFYNLTNLINADIHINSSIVSNCSGFIYPKNTSATRNVYVPLGSTTETTFNAVASALGLTIIGE